jgi:hypothetical protein
VTAGSKPDSIRSKVEELVREVSVDRGHGVLAQEIHGLYEERHGYVRRNVVTNALSVLVAAGTLVKCGGRIGTTSYGHACCPVPAAPDRVAEAAIATVTKLANRSQFAVPTEAVYRALTESHVAPGSVDRLRTILTSLAHASAAKEERAHPDWATPRIAKIDHVTTGGRKRAYWSFPGGPADPPPISDVYDAARQAVSSAATALGRPAAKRELVLWARAVLGGGATGDERVAEAVLKEGFAAKLSGCATRDAGSAHNSRLTAVRTHLTSRGAYPVRYAIGEVPSVELDTCIVDDIARQLSPVEELEGVEALRDHAAAVADPTLAALADLRTGVINRIVLHCLGGDSGAIDRLRQAVAQGARARSVLSEWTGYVPGYPFEQQVVRDAIVGEGAAAEALLRAAAFSVVDGAEGLTSVATYPGTPLLAFRDLALEANELTGREAKHWENLLAPVRRVRGARAGGVSAAVPDDMRASVDRPDALALLVRSAGLPIASALVAEAERIMGHVLRDADLMLSLLRDGASHEARPALVVAAALLGRVAPMEHAWPNPRSFDEAWVYVTALALGEDDPAERLRLAEAADLRARGAASQVTEGALLQFEAGFRLAALG